MSSDGIGIASEVATFAIDHTAERPQSQRSDQPTGPRLTQQGPRCSVGKEGSWLTRILLMQCTSHSAHTCPAFLCLSCLSEPWRIRAGIKFLHASYNHLNHKL